MNFYADKVNGQFHKSESHYIGLAQRLRETINNETWKETIVEDDGDVLAARCAAHPGAQHGRLPEHPGRSRHAGAGQARRQRAAGRQSAGRLS